MALALVMARYNLLFLSKFPCPNPLLYGVGPLEKRLFLT